MQIELWWLWMALAAVLLIGEILTAGFFLLWFSVGAAAAGVLAMLGVGHVAQLIVFSLLSGILFVFGRRFADRVTAKQPPGIGADRFVGMAGIVLEEIDNYANSGNIWRAGSEDGDVIPVDSRIRVIRIEGTRAFVRTIEKEIE
jgi:membrane protein implicated in regulation of membrane protease activity